MSRPPRDRSPRSDEVDPLGMDEAKQSFWSRSFGLVLPDSVQSLLPVSAARRGLSVAVATDRSTIRVGEQVEITIAIRNRLPMRISVPIEGKQPWGWAVDGLEAAREEPRYRSRVTTELTLEGRERREYTRQWEGKFRRTGDPPRWVDADPGTYEIEGYVPVEGGSVFDVTEITVK